MTTYRISYDDDKSGYEDFSDDLNNKYSKFLVNSSENGEEFVITLEKAIKNAKISLVEDMKYLKSENKDYFINTISNRANRVNKKNDKTDKRKEKNKSGFLRPLLCSMVSPLLLIPNHTKFIKSVHVLLQQIQSNFIRPTSHHQ